MSHLSKREYNMIKQTNSLKKMLNKKILRTINYAFDFDRQTPC